MSAEEYRKLYADLALMVQRLEQQGVSSADLQPVKDTLNRTAGFIESLYGADGLELEEIR